MKIKMITLYAGPNGVMENGREYDVNPALAKQLVDGRFAVMVGREPAPVVIETAVAPVEFVEKAVIEQPERPAFKKARK